MPTSLFITFSLFINLAKICQSPRLFRPPLLFKTREYKGTIKRYNLKIMKTSTGDKQAAFIFFIFVFFNISDTLQKMKFSIKDFFSKCDQIQRKLRIWSHLLKKSVIENFIFMKTNCSNHLKKNSMYIYCIIISFLGVQASLQLFSTSTV